ncbi:uncharacterized protein BDW70DRAFT_163525 [Aspergillus foveolatus]|uniref:uncharacterized protein n=1 Tax=Aspergillus foveolatus TaxID=210207 RepID=UPI003CCDDB3B
MTPATARLLPRAPSFQVTRGGEPLGKSYDNAAYRLPDNAAAGATSPHGEPTGQTGPAVNADARPNLPGLESAIEAAKLQETISEVRFNPQPPPIDNASPLWCSTSSASPCPEEYDRSPPTQQFQDLCEDTDNHDLVKVRSVSSGMVAMRNPADISVDALAGRLSGEKERQTQHSPEESLPTQIQSAIQREISPVKLSTFQVFRVETAFVPRNGGHMEVSEGQLVRLEQTFDDGWAWCTLVETGMQGLILEPVLRVCTDDEIINPATKPFESFHYTLVENTGWPSMDTFLVGFWIPGK